MAEGASELSCQPERLAIPQIDFRDRTLRNGLRVLTVEDHSTATVAIQVWYKVGSKEDPRGLSGLAHLLEHMMFKGTRHMQAEMIDRLTEDVGGFNNAATTEDSTVFWEVVPSNHLESLLWAEAERLAFLDLNEANLESEREVVKEEIRQKLLVPPYGRLPSLIAQRSFSGTPYGRPSIGIIEELDSVSLEEVCAFRAKYYRPDNATLVVGGDFDGFQLDAAVDRHFGPIAKPAEPVPHVRVQEPAQTDVRRFEDFGTHVPLPAVAVSYAVPRAAAPEAAALKIVEAILATGESSRLCRSLRYRQEVAQKVSARADLREDAGLFVLEAILAGGRGAPEGEYALLSELEILRREGISPAELEKAKNLVLTRVVRERQTNDGKARALGCAALLLGTPTRVNTDIRRMQQTSADDVDRLVNRYFAETSRLVFHYLPGERPKTERPEDAVVRKNDERG